MEDLPKACWGSALSGPAYIQFLASLDQRGMLQFTLMIEEEAGIFCEEEICGRQCNCNNRTKIVLPHFGTSKGGNSL